MQNVTRAISLVKNYANQVIEASVIEYVCGKIEKRFIYQEELAVLEGKADKNLLMLFKNIDFPI